MPYEDGPSEDRLYEDRGRASSFGAEAARYDRIRPTYPGPLVDALLAGLAPARVVAAAGDVAADRAGFIDAVDVGCGTGIVARLLLERRCRVLGVEPDERMADIARRSSVSVEHATFEAWGDGGRRFDLLTAGQSWHWVNPMAGAAKAARVLRPSGRIGLFWNCGMPSEDLRRHLQPAYQRYAPGLDEYSVLLGNGIEDRLDLAAGALRANDRFVDVVVSRFGHDRTYTSDEWVDSLRTHSDHATLEPVQRERLLTEVKRVVDEMGGAFVMHYEPVLVSAMRA